MLKTTVRGDPTSDDVIVFVHGWPDDSREFAPLLSGDLSRRRCVLVDLPRLDGRAWEGEDLSFGRLADLLAAVIEAEKRPVSLVAHDWGAFVAGLLMSRRPELIRRLALLDVGAQPTSFLAPSLAIRWVLIATYQSINALIYAMYLLLGVLGLRPLRRLLDALNIVWIATLCTPSGFKCYGQPRHAAVNYFYYNAVSFLATSDYTRMQAALRKPPMPLLFLHGTSMFHDATWAAAMRARPSCSAVFVGRGHWFWYREPECERVVRELCAWMGRGASASPSAARRARSPSKRSPARATSSPPRSAGRVPRSVRARAGAAQKGA